LEVHQQYGAEVAIAVHFPDHEKLLLVSSIVVLVRVPSASDTSRRRSAVRD
jgi:hypothetical protein